jgi:predicted SprT family Zn-dependent metalloprotease
MNTLLEQMNIKISKNLKVPKLKITYKVSEKAKSKFGHCRYIEPGHYLINLSSFILGTELEKDTICHELCHAYDHFYFKSLNNDPAPHGVAWKMLMKEVFGYVNIKAQGIHQSKENELIKTGDGMFDLYVNGNKKAMFTVENNIIYIRTPQNKFFNSVLEEEKYMTAFFNLYKNNYDKRKTNPSKRK